MRSSTTYTRDAALRKLSRINRWLIAGSVALTALLSEVAARAFPGKAAAATSTKVKSPRVHSSNRAGSARPPSGTLQAPAESPRAASEATPESAPAQEPAPEASRESAPNSEAAPEPETTAPEPAHESAPAREPAPAPEPSAPVTSGGS
jgi:hypothetical protein